MGRPKGRPKGDVDRLLLRKKFGQFRELSEFKWKDLEAAIETPLPIEARDQIVAATGMFAAIAPLYSPANTIRLEEIRPQIESWLSATNKLRRALRASPLFKNNEGIRTKFIAKYLNEKRLVRMGKTPPLGFLALAMQSALAAGTLVLKELREEERNGPLKKDLWSVWVCLVAQILEGQGARISASILKNDKNSPFVNAIKMLEENLPAEHRHSHSHPALAKAIQKARRTFRTYDHKILWAILAGYGSNLLKGYPGNLETKTRETISNFKADVERSLETLKLTRKLGDEF
jgi:hypothetical protein